jgi:predicted RNase H-like nuclease (RuvC/YqgF family)
MRVDSVKASTSQGFYPKKSSAEKSLHASFVTLPELLAERSEKFDGELKSVQERHYKEVDILENKIRRLERELREKDRIVSEQKMEIMSMRDSVMSSRGFMTQTHLGAPKAHSVSPQ